MDEINYEELDPGIRAVVKMLRDAGWQTTDSGDGVSKPADWYQPDEQGITQAMNFPHVVCRTDPVRLVEDAKDLLGWLPTWRIEATYCPNDGTALLIAMDQPVPSQRA